MNGSIYFRIIKQCVTVVKRLAISTCHNVEVLYVYIQCLKYIVLLFYRVLYVLNAVFDVFSDQFKIS
jgi:hypothetical protein